MADILEKSGHNCSSLTDWQTKSKGQATERIIKTTIETLNRTYWNTIVSHILEVAFEFCVILVKFMYSEKATKI